VGAARSAMTEQVGAVEDEIAEETVHPPEGMRVRTAKGVLINTAFRVGLAVIALGRNVAFAAFLTREEYGLWGLVLTTLITIAFLKQIGISDKFVQQREPDQEAAFQKAFSLELAYSGIFYVFAIIAIPVYALVVYGQEDVLLPALALSVSLLVSAFQSPIWIYYRRLQYGKQRALESIDPLITTVLTVGLLAAGAGIWGLVIGSLVGSIAAAVAAIIVSPYKLRWRFDRGTLGEYVSFSWPLLLSGIGSLAVVQGALIVGEAALGLAAVGVIGLAGNIAGFGNRVELLLRNTLYPAVAARRERLDLLRETFVKSNRLGLMWAFPFGFALALFAGNVVDAALGPEWEDAIPVLRVFGLIFAFGTVAFAWGTMYQAIGNTRPFAVTTAVTVTVFFAVTVPLMLEIGTMGYAWGMLAATAAQLCLRGYYLRKLFEGFNLALHTVRALAPVAIAVGAVLAIRLAHGEDAGGGWVWAELGVFVVLTVAFTVLFERALIREALGYLRRATKRNPKPAAEAVA
jgi:O-antigen/teichoic acid export membrane protein